MKRLLLVLGALVLTLGAGAIAGILVVRAALDEPMPLPAEGVLVRIPTGFSLRQSAQRLTDAGVLASPWPLIALARWQRVERELRAGEYLFQGAPSPRDVLARLRSREPTEHRITIPEGRTAGEIFAALEGAGFGGADVFACIAASPEWLLRHDLPPTGVEGYLFPDTYGFDYDTPPEAILDALVARHRVKTEPLQPARVAAGLAPHEMVTLASIIEKETGNGDERALIAAVFLNRLRLGMPLQSDPTAVYERPEARGRRVTCTDVRTAGDYNTYLIRGLPPGPIANPGLAALDAAVHPANVDSLYFVARKDGTHVFSRTLDEHNRAVAELRDR